MTEDIIDTYFAAERAVRALLKEAGFRERWHLDPLVDERDKSWVIEGDSIFYWDTDDACEPLSRKAALALVEAENYYPGEVRGEVVRVGGFAVAVVDTNCDGNVVAMILDERLECKDEEVLALLRGDL